MQHGTDSMDQLAPHLSNERHGTRQCRHPECRTQTREEWCTRHHHSPLHKFLLWSEHLEMEVGVIPSEGTVHLVDCYCPSSLDALTEASEVTGVCGHCTKRLETIMRGKLMGGPEGLIELASHELELPLVQAPGGDRLHLSGCKHLPEDEDRWRPAYYKDAGASRRAKGVCTACLDRAEEEGAYELMEAIES